MDEQKPDLSEFHHEHRKFAEQVWSETARADEEDESGFIPVLFAFCLDERKQVDNSMIALPFLGDEKHSMFRGLGYRFYQERKQPLMLTLVTEAWAAPRDGNPAQPSQRTDRQEILLVASLDATGRDYMSTIQIRRSPSGESRLEPEWKEEQGARQNLLAQVFMGYFEAQGEEEA